MEMKTPCGAFFCGDLRANASIGPYREQTFRLHRRKRLWADMESAHRRFILVVLHSCVDRAGAVELLGQNKTRQLVRQRDASQADAGLCGALDAVVQSVGGADDKRHIPCATHGAVCNHSRQILTGYLLTLDTERNEIRPPAHAGQDGLPLLLQCFGDLPVAGVLVGNLHLG